MRSEKEEIEFGKKRAVNGPTSGGSGFVPTAIDTLQSCDSTETVLCCCFFFLCVYPRALLVSIFSSFSFSTQIPRPIPTRACPTMANRDPIRQKRGKAKKPIPDALLSGPEYDYQDEDVQSTTAIAGSQEAFWEQHNTKVIPQPPSGESKAKEGFSFTEAMKSMWSVLMLDREDIQKEREYQDRKEMLEREDRQKERVYQDRKEMLQREDRQKEREERQQEREYHKRKEMQWKIDLAKRDEEALQKEEWAREAQEQKEERARVAQEMRDAALREEMAKQSEEQRAREAQRQRQHFLS